MKKLVRLALLALSMVVTSIPAQAELLQPAHVFTVRDLNNDGSVDAFDDVPPQIGIPSFWGVVSRLPAFTDETFVEFNISGLGAASQATLSFDSAAKPPVLKSVRIRLGSDLSMAGASFLIKASLRS
ncbi:MAG: hypothetical protein EXQ58_08900 [Acidobacteria bacterium]|nr:hypothetical protein [Acidobacteriota bacterium]